MKEHIVLLVTVAAFSALSIRQSWAQTAHGASATSGQASANLSAAGILAMNGVVLAAQAVGEGSLAASKQTVIASKDAFEASRAVALQAIEWTRPIVIKTVQTSKNAVHITYEVSMNGIEIAATLGRAGINASVDASATAYRYTVKMSRQALAASLKAANWTVEQLEQSGEIAVNAVALTLGAASSVVGYVLVLAASPAVVIGVALNDLGMQLMDSSTRE